MMLLVDAGNTRLKWAMSDDPAEVLADSSWVHEGSLACTAIDQLAPCWADLPHPDQVVVANVAGPQVAARIAEAIGSLRSASATPLRWFTPGQALGNLRNGYRDPAQLGPDRWAAAVGAWQRIGRTCLVVSAGTATTIDGIVADVAGVGASHVGGMILPGLALMRHSLDAGTARLRQTPGRHVEWPRQTADAIESGCLEAQLGAIERARQRLGANVPVVLTGGAAVALSERLDLPVVRAPRLVFEGLRLAALSER